MFFSMSSAWLSSRSLFPYKGRSVRGRTVLVHWRQRTRLQLFQLFVAV